MMPVYVDSLATHPAAHGHTRWCHMIADTLDELHALADRIGHRREWFQASPPASFPHYDLTASRRARAVLAGAIECDWRTFVRHMQRIRSERAALPPTDDALIPK